MNEEKRTLGKPTHLAGRIVYIRKSLKMNQRNFAKATGISQSFLSMLESGLHEPSVAFIRAVHNLTGQSYDWIIDGKEKEEDTVGYILANKLNQFNSHQRTFLLDVVNSYSKSLENS